MKALGRDSSLGLFQNSADISFSIARKEHVVLFHFVLCKIDRVLRKMLFNVAH